MALDKATLLASVRLKTETITIDGLGEIRVRELSGGERDRWVGRNFDVATGEVKPDAIGTLRPSLVAMVLIDDAGNRMFSDAEVNLVGQLPSDVLDQLYSAAAQLSGLDAVARAAAKNG